MAEKLPMRRFFDDQWLEKTFPGDKLTPDNVLEHAKRDGKERVQNEETFKSNVQERIKVIQEERKKHNGSWYC